MAKPFLPSGRLKQRRLDLGLSQAELASRAGLEQSQVSKFERNLDVRLSTLAKILTALDLDLAFVPRARPGAASGKGEDPSRMITIEPFDTAGYRFHVDVPASHPDTRSYPIPGTSERFVPRTGTLLDRFAIPDDEEPGAKKGLRRPAQPRPRKR